MRMRQSNVNVLEWICLNENHIYVFVFFVNFFFKRSNQMQVKYRNSIDLSVSRLFDCLCIAWDTWPLHKNCWSHWCTLYIYLVLFVENRLTSASSHLHLFDHEREFYQWNEMLQQQFADGSWGNWKHHSKHFTFNQFCFEPF